MNLKFGLIGGPVKMVLLAWSGPRGPGLSLSTSSLVYCITFFYITCQSLSQIRFDYCIYILTALVMIIIFMAPYPCFYYINHVNLKFAHRDGWKYIGMYFDTKYRYWVRKFIVIQNINTGLRNVFEIQIHILYLKYMKIRFIKVHAITRKSMNWQILNKLFVSMSKKI